MMKQETRSSIIGIFVTLGLIALGVAAVALYAALGFAFNAAVTSDREALIEQSKTPSTQITNVMMPNGHEAQCIILYAGEIPTSMECKIP